jgi:hypothetical protein
MTRREALSLIPAGAAGAWSSDAVRSRLPGEAPAGVAAILTRILNQPPQSLNTDWFGTMPLVGLLQWTRRGIAEGKPFATDWLTHHLQAKDVASYTGNRSRVVWAGGIPLTTYAGHFGVSQVCEELMSQFDDKRARSVAADIASIVLQPDGAQPHRPDRT